MAGKPIEEQLSSLGIRLRQRSSERALWGVWGDLVEVGADIAERCVQVECRGPWERWCREQLAAERTALRTMERISWAQMDRAYEACRLAWSPRRGRHVPPLTRRVERVCADEAARVELARRLGSSYPDLVRWLAGTPSPRLARRVRDWLERGEEAFPYVEHPELVVKRDRAAYRPRKRRGGQDQLDLFGASG